MTFTNKQEHLIKKLIEKKANKIVSYMILIKTEKWGDGDVDKLIDFISDKNSSIKDIVDFFEKLDEKYPDDSDNISEKNDKEQDNKPFLFMFYNGGQAGLMKFEIGTNQADYFWCDLWDFNTCRLPKDINDDKELEQCAEDWIYPSEWTIKNYVKLRETDYTKYKAVIVWNDMTPNSLLFLYTVCKFVKGCNIYENNVSKFDMCPVQGIDDPDRDFSGIFDGIRPITPQLKEYFTKIYDDYAGKPVSPKIAKGYEIVEVSENIIRERILSKCTNKYKTAFSVIIDILRESVSGSQDYIGFGFFQKKIFNYALADVFDIKQHGTDNSCYATDQYVYKGVDISNPRFYSIKLKE